MSWGERHSATGEAWEAAARSAVRAGACGTISMRPSHLQGLARFATGVRIYT